MDNVYSMIKRYLKGLRNRVFQILSLHAPGAKSLRVWLHRWRGVEIGEDVFIGTDVLLETAFPHYIKIGKGVVISMRCTLIAHFEMVSGDKENENKKIPLIVEDYAFIGPCSTILPNVKIGYGAVVAAGSVVNRSVPPLTMVRGNPARPVAKFTTPITQTTYDEFVVNLKPLS